MLNVDEDRLAEMESQYAGIVKTIRGIEKADYPPCPKCGSTDTESVNCGLVGRTGRIAEATTKFHLRANDKPGEFFCNSCREYFDRVIGPH